MIHRRGKRLIGDLTAPELDTLTRFITREQLPLITLARRLNGPPRDGINLSIYVANKFRALNSCTSKEIREAFFPNELITDYKIGLRLSKNEALNWCTRITKLTSTRHKNIILRVAHGDIYTNDKLFRFGLKDSNLCPRCDQVDTLQHKMYECPYTNEIWKRISSITGENTPEPAKMVLGATMNTNVTFLTLKAEVLLRIMALKPDENYLLHPKYMVTHALNLIKRRERDQSVKREIEALLNSNLR